jgi:hypothetical protein
VARRTGFVLFLIALFSYEAYALFVRESGLTANEPRAADRHLTREVNADTPLTQTFVMHGDGFSGVELFVRRSDQPPIGPVEVVISQDLPAGWVPFSRSTIDVASIDLDGDGSMLVTTPRVEQSAGFGFLVQVSMPRAPRGHGLRFEAGGSTYVQGHMTLGGREEWGDLKFRTRAARATVLRNIRHQRLAWPAPLDSDLFWVIALIVINWALATVAYYLAFSPGVPETPDAPEVPLPAKGSALTTADQPRV